MIQPIILAAGKGSRLKSEFPKAVFPLLGKPMVHRVIESLAGLPDTKSPIVVVGHLADIVRKELPESIQTVEQTELTGSATAIRDCLPHLDSSDAVIIMNADQPLVTPETFQNVLKLHTENPEALVIGTVKVPDFTDWRSPFISYGRIVRVDGNITRNVEYKDATETERDIKEVNVGLYCVPVSWLKDAIAKIQPSPVTGEFYLTEILDLATQEGREIISSDVPAAEALGVNTQEDARHAEMVMQRTVMA